jgi:hypothetical protein
MNGMQPSVFNAPELLSTPAYWTAMKVTKYSQWYWEYRDEYFNMGKVPMAYTHWAPGEDPAYASFVFRLSFFVFRYSFFVFRLSFFVFRFSFFVFRLSFLHLTENVN